MKDTPDTTNVLTRLRALRGDRANLTFAGVRSLAERQAALLTYASAESDLPVEGVIADMPRIRVQAGDIPTSGLSYWDGQQWVITFNVLEPRTRQRFTILHEFKHIIDHPAVHDLYRGHLATSAREQMELAADYFAGCVLVPRDLLIDAWNGGLREPTALARHFDVSVRAINVRIAQTGLRRDTDRRPSRTTHTRTRTRIATQPERSAR